MKGIILLLVLVVINWVGNVSQIADNFDPSSKSNVEFNIQSIDFACECVFGVEIDDEDFDLELKQACQKPIKNDVNIEVCIPKTFILKSPIKHLLFELIDLPPPYLFI